MISLLFCAQLAAAAHSADSTYSSPALRDLIAAAAVANHEPPADLGGYRSHIETETSLILRDTLGRERSAEVEQLATRATWGRTGTYDLHIVGYRSQSVGVPYSTLSIVRAWTVPTLYGERLSMGAYFTRANTSDTLTAVHPFAADRDRYYRFSGGDTVAVLHSGGRDIPIVRIHAHPNIHGRTRLGAFDGEIDLDAQRKQIVRMRGQFVILGGRRTKLDTFAKVAGIIGVAYIEFVNAEVDGRYWLPAFQRTEFQAGFALLGQSRPIFRIVSSISDIATTDTTVTARDSAKGPGVVVTWAPGDSVSSFGDWQRGLGAQSTDVHSDDFQDLAPDVWRTDGPPRVSFFPNATSRLYRFNRVEGLYLGLAPTVDFRSFVPGLSTGAFGGWAFAERTVRGGGFVTYHRGENTYGLRAERSLASTNDFALPYDQDPGIGALLGSVDNYDYVDRRRAMASFTRVVGAVEVGLATVQLGVGNDQGERARLEHGLLWAGTGFRPNRGVTPGNYALASADAEFHPNVTGDFVEPGIGARGHYEIGSGQLDWQRLELALSARRYWGPISLAAHADGGMVIGNDPPPQQLFELGGPELLPGYNYKQFSGDRAALFRTFASYRFGIWKRPMHVVRNYYMPGLSPGIGASIQGGWTEISSPGAAQAVRDLGVVNGIPVSTATNGMRATAGFGLTLFSDILHVGVARAVDRPEPWRFVAGFGAAF
jgi:hypothetical protein